MKESTIQKYIDKNFSDSDSYEKEHLRTDWQKKEKDAVSIVLDFEKRVELVSKKRILDIGFGNGIILGAFSKKGAIMTGIEVDETLRTIAKEYLDENNILGDLYIHDGLILPFEDNSFDYVFSTSVLEHVDNPDIFLKEANRVLKSGGKMYLAFPNRFAFRDSHSGVYFLGYLPHFFADKLLSFLGKGSLKNWNLHFLSYFTLLRIIKRNKINFRVVMETEAKTPFRKIIKKTLAFFGIHFGAILSHIIIILEKK